MEVVTGRGYVVRVRVGVGVRQRGVVKHLILWMHGTGPVERTGVPHVVQRGRLLRGRVVETIAARPRNGGRRLLQGGKRERVMRLLLLLLRRNSRWMRSGVPLLVMRGRRRLRRRWRMSFAVVVERHSSRWRGHRRRGSLELACVGGCHRRCCRRRGRRRGTASRRQLLGRVLRQGAVDGQRDGVVHSKHEESVSGDRLVHRQVDALAVVVVQRAQTLKGRRARLPESVDIKVELELLWIGGAEPHAAGKVRLDPRAEWDHSDLLDHNRLRELDEVEVELRLQVVAERVEEEQLLP